MTRTAKRTAALGLLTLFLVGYALAIGMRGSDDEADPVDVSLFERPGASPFFEPGIEDVVAPGELPELTIELRPEMVEKLVAKRAAALRDGYLMTDPDDYVAARVALDGARVKARVRLKGDMVGHVKGPKWSFRIKVRGDAALEGMKVFSIHHPKHRGYLREWTYHRMLAQEGVVSLRYDFVKVVINGNPVGIYALEEHFDKRLVEHNRRREGPILRFDESPLWDAFLRRRQEGGDVDSTGISLTTSVRSFRESSLRGNPVQLAYFEKAAALLDGFRKGRLRTSEVFDIELLARYYAVAHLLGATHGTSWNNSRYYYNPVTARLEPIGFDGQPARLTDEKGAFKLNRYFGFYNKLAFADVEFCRAYRAAVQRVLEKDYVTAFLDGTHEEYERIAELLPREFESHRPSRSYIRRNRDTLEATLESFEGFDAYASLIEGGRVELHYLNEAGIPIEIKGLKLGADEIEPGETQIVFPYAKKRERRIYSATYRAPRELESDEDVSVLVAFPGSNELVEKQVLFDDRPDVREEPLAQALVREEMASEPLPLEPDLLRQDPNPGDFPFLTVDETRRTVAFAAGTCALRKSLLLPAGYRVTVPAGTTIELHDGASIVSSSPLLCRGTDEEPIVIISPDGTGGGLGILRAFGQSEFRRVRFENLANPAEGGWQLLGAVTLYESRCAFTDCTFVGNRSEDSLNIVRSPFRIVRSTFEGTQSDALDLDFSDGAISDSRFESCGNDGVDASGSEIALERVTVRGTGDKGISAGEESRLQLDDIRIADAGIGIASKDRSLILGDRVEIQRSRIGMSAYQKKPEFGPARIEVTNLLLEESDLPFLIEAGSSINVDSADVVGAGRKKTDLVLDRIKNGQPVN